MVKNLSKAFRVKKKKKKIILWKDKFGSFLYYAPQPTEHPSLRLDLASKKIKTVLSVAPYFNLIYIFLLQV